MIFQQIFIKRRTDDDRKGRTSDNRHHLDGQTGLLKPSRHVLARREKDSRAGALDLDTGSRSGDGLLRHGQNKEWR